MSNQKRRLIAAELRWFASAAALVDRPDRQDALLARAEEASERENRARSQLVDLTGEDDFESALADLTQITELRNTILQRVAEIRRQRAQGSTAPTGPSLGVVTRLPNIELPIFGGEVTEWPTFRNLFDSLVHLRTDLPAAYKVAQLMAALRGEPRELLAHLPVTEDSYQTARDLLFRRYDNQRLQIDAQMSRLVMIVMTGDPVY